MSVVARELVPAAVMVAEARKRGVRLYRYQSPPRVAAVTSDSDVAAWLKALGASRGSFTEADGSYQRAPGIPEWDFDLHTAKVIEHYYVNEDGEEVFDGTAGSTAIWEAAAS